VNLATTVRLAVAVPVPLAVVALGLVVWLDVRSNLLQELDHTLAARAAGVADRFEFDQAWERDFEEELPAVVVEGLVGWRVTGDDGQALSEQPIPGDARVWQGRFGVDTEGRDAPAQVVVEVGADVAPIRSTLRRLFLVILATGAALSLGAIGVGELVAGRIVDRADHDALAASLARQVRFSADAAHELRTPLAVIRTEVEVTLRAPREGAAYRDALGVVLAAVTRLQGVVDALMVLARADAGQPPHRERCDLVALTHQALHDEGDDPRVQVVGPEQAPIDGDPRQLRLLLRNLLSNARRHTPADGQIRVELGPRRIVVVDTGEGIAPELLPRVFERFTRAEYDRGRARGGAGLGLSLVRAIAASHGGTVSLTSTLGQGTRVLVDLG
jgi:signal transduction histidine kinase